MVGASLFSWVARLIFGTFFFFLSCLSVLGIWECQTMVLSLWCAFFYLIFPLIHSFMIRTFRNLSTFCDGHLHCRMVENRSIHYVVCSRLRSGTEPCSVSHSMLDHHLRQWYRSQAQAQVQGGPAPDVALREDAIIYTDLHWTRLMFSRFMAARVAQFLIGHFPNGTYLFWFHLRPSPVCECC